MTAFLLPHDYFIHAEPAHDEVLNLDCNRGNRTCQHGHAALARVLSADDVAHVLADRLSKKVPHSPGNLLNVRFGRKVARVQELHGRI